MVDVIPILSLEDGSVWESRGLPSRECRLDVDGQMMVKEPRCPMEIPAHSRLLMLVSNEWVLSNFSGALAMWPVGVDAPDYKFFVFRRGKLIFNESAIKPHIPVTVSDDVSSA